VREHCSVSVSVRTGVFIHQVSHTLRLLDKLTTPWHTIDYAPLRGECWGSHRCAAILEFQELQGIVLDIGSHASVEKGNFTTPCRIYLLFLK
jgi:hypothetical protein